MSHTSFSSLPGDRYFSEMESYQGPMHVPNKRLKKPAGAPKRAMSAFLSFSRTMRPEVRAQYPDMKNTDISGLLAKKWHQASEEEKKPYLVKELKEREKYHEDMGKWKQQVEDSKDRALRERACLDDSLSMDMNADFDGGLLFGMRSGSVPNMGFSHTHGRHDSFSGQVGVGRRGHSMPSGAVGVGASDMRFPGTDARVLAGADPSAGGSMWAFNDVPVAHGHGSYSSRASPYPAASTQSN